MMLAVGRPKQPGNPWLLVLAGHGPRRWHALDAAAAPAIGLAIADVRDRFMPRLQVGPTGKLEPAAALATLQRIQAWCAAGLAVAGWLGYELGAALESAPTFPAGSDLPDADLVAFDPRDLQPVTLPTVPVTAGHVPLPEDLLRQEGAFVSGVRTALAAIAAGEVYQVNLSLQATVSPPAVGWSLPQALAAVLEAQPVPLAMAWQGDGYRLVSGSMERFLRVEAGTVRSRPIKGTSARGGDATSDAAQAAALVASAKERAENTMIVDMVRNDLQRACRMGSVTVPVLLEAVPYATLWHLESEVAGELVEPLDRAALLAATLPPASVTGCPKIQATQVIARLERRRRGPYCGALGLWQPDGHVDLAVGIRQLVVWPDRAVLNVGAGLVADSSPEAEWREVCLKAASALRLVRALDAAASHGGS